MHFANYIANNEAGVGLEEGDGDGEQAKPRGSRFKVRIDCHLDANEDGRL